MRYHSGHQHRKHRQGSHEELIQASIPVLHVEGHAVQCGLKKIVFRKQGFCDTNSRELADIVIGAAFFREEICDNDFEENSTENFYQDYTR